MPTGALGFVVSDGPSFLTQADLETIEKRHAKVAKDHAQRDLTALLEQARDTLEDGTLLRTQTSTVQIRIMENTKPPVRIIAPGRCYR